MDVTKKEKKNKLNQYWKPALALITLLLGLWVFDQTKNINLKKQDLLFAKVERGDLQIQVEGFGHLQSAKLQLLTSFTDATVDTIIVKPGAIIKKGSAILKLSNPELEQEVYEAQQDLNQKKANLRQLLLNQQKELLIEEAKLAEVSARYESAKLRKAALEKLVESGVVASLTYQDSVLAEIELKKVLTVHRQLNEKLNLVHKQAVNIAEDVIKRQQSKLDIANQRLSRLVVKSGINGALLRQSVKIGQSLSANQEIGLVGSTEKLIALIKVPQSKADQIQIGQKASIDTRKEKIIGVVSRIDPIVKDSTVEVEIELPDKLPSSARVNMNVNATIFVETLKNVAILNRPINVSAFSMHDLYRLDPSNSSASSVNVSIGQVSDTKIQIDSGAREGEIFIVSDTSSYKGQPIKISD